MKKRDGERVIAFIETYCKVPEGVLVGKRIKLEPFQKKFIRAVYDNPKQTRRAYLSIARKNGKTAVIAGICLAHLIGPMAVRNSQIVSGAMSRDQAGIVFKHMVNIINLEPKLQGLVRIIPSQKRLVGLPMNVEYRALAADGKTAHGLSPVVAILDEVGQVRGPHSDFVEAITTAQGAYENPLLIVISTQAQNDGDLLSIWLDDAKDSKDPQIVSHVYEAPKDCALSDRKAWKSANPALGTFRSLKDVESQALMAARMPSSEPGFRNLILNQRVETESPFVSRSVWESNGGEVPETWKDWPVFAGLDLSSTTDLTALVLVAVEPGPIYHVKPFFWLPGDGLRDKAAKDKVPYDVWHKDGLLLSTPGKAIDYEYVASDLKTILAGLDWQAVEFDRWNMKHFKPSLERADFRADELERFTEFGQGFISMSPAIKALEVALLKNQLRHGMHPVLAMCAANARVVTDPAENRKFVKGKSTGRIDGMVALAMAMSAATKHAESAGDFMAAWGA